MASDPKEKTGADPTKSKNSADAKTSDKKKNRRHRRKPPASKKQAASAEGEKAASVKPLSIDEETRWKPRSVFRSADCSASEVNEAAGVRDARLVRWLLNKVTPSNFDKVMMDFASETAIYEDNRRLKDAIKTIIDRAAIDPRYASVYAQVCGRLVKDLQGTTAGDYGAATDTGTAFHNLLLQICEEEVNQDTQQVVERCQRAGSVAVSRIRRRYVCGKRLIGELHNHDALEAKHVIQYLISLLDRARGGLSQLERSEIDELALEGFCVLLDACGKHLDESRPTLKKPQAEDLQRCWDALGAMVLVTSNPPRLSFRMRSMALDLAELRQLSWHPARYGARQKREMVPRALLVDVVPGAGTRGRNKNGKKKVHFVTKGRSE